jgi:hypothetical protein
MISRQYRLNHIAVRPNRSALTAGENTSYVIKPVALCIWHRDCCSVRRKKSNPSGLLHTLGELLPMAVALVEVRLCAGIFRQIGDRGCFSAAIARSPIISFRSDVPLTPSGRAAIFLRLGLARCRMELSHPTSAIPSSTLVCVPHKRLACHAKGSTTILPAMEAAIHREYFGRE